MKKKNKVLIVLCICALLSALSCPLSCYAYEQYTPPITTSPSQGASTYAHNIKWVYKSVDGKLYRRLYNYTTSQWIGNWILCS